MDSYPTSLKRLPFVAHCALTYRNMQYSVNIPSVLGTDTQKLIVNKHYISYFCYIKITFHKLY